MSKPEPKKRLSLLERQEQLLEEKGFSRRGSDASATASAASKAGAKASSSVPLSSASNTGSASRLLSRNDELLIRQGRGNATAASRNAVPMREDMDNDLDDGTKSVGGVSAVPSIHPSIAASVARSVACSETTIGAGDDTKYWDYQHREAIKSDLGHCCRECRKPFSKIGEPITERRGARVSMRYHAECFSGFADPRSQTRSSHHEGRLAGSQHDAAPSLTSSKMRTETHFSGGGSGKNLANQLAIGRLSFARSDRGSGLHPTEGPVTAGAASSSSGGLNAASLAQLDSGDGAGTRQRGASILLERVLEEGEADHSPQKEEDGAAEKKEKKAV